MPRWPMQDSACNAIESTRQSGGGRGWSGDDWAAACEKLSARGLIASDESLTASGRQLRAQIENDTDTLAMAPYSAVGEPAIDRLLDALSPAASQVAASGDLIFPNPMGLPDPRNA